MADTSSGLDQIWKSERDAVKNEVRLGGCLPVVAAATADIVATLPTRLRSQAPVAISQLSGRGDVAFVASCPSLSYKTLWVRADDDAYAKYYLEFLDQYHNLKFSGVPKPYNVDHMFNRQRALKYAYRYVRMALVNGPVNSSHGAGYEKSTTNSRRERRDTSIALMDEIGSMKFYGFMNPSVAKPNQAEIDRYARFSALEFGMSESEVKECIAGCLKSAAFFKN